MQAIAVDAVTGWQCCCGGRVLRCDCVVTAQIINSTLGKAMGGATGGYTTACRQVVELLKNKSRPYLFSNALAPFVVRTVCRALLELRRA